jgi:hypothetical protein
MERLVDGRVRNRGEIRVVTLHIGAVHLIKALADYRDAKDVARGQLKHRSKVLCGKDMIVPEGDWASAILRPGVDVECHDELMGPMLVG